MDAITFDDLCQPINCLLLLKGSNSFKYILKNQQDLGYNHYQLSDNPEKQTIRLYTRQTTFILNFTTCKL